MQKQIYLPNVELNMEGVTVTEWRVSVGDRIDRDQVLMEVETQKAAVEVPSPEAGYIRRLCVSPGDEVGEKHLLCIITDLADEPFEMSEAGARGDIPGVAEPRDAAVAPDVEGGSGIRSVPLARKMAKDAGIAIESISGTGPNGRISVADVQSAIGRQIAPGLASQRSIPGEWIELPAARVALNGQMMRSLAEIPQVHLTRQMDVTPLTVKQPGITFTHRLIVAAASALLRHPALRTKIDGSRVRVEPVNVAVAMDTPQGLVAPVIRGAGDMRLPDVASALTDLRERAASGHLRRDEFADGPFAITNLGMYGVDFFSAFVFHGQTAVLAVGQSTPSTAGRHIAWMSLALDHRVVDGAEGARFLQTLQAAILEPSS